ncbi:MAG: hypothetical protein K6E98_07895 [Lachnospiraceae bacterium]|nr:hypothetical protein [Lachnospiraceae bacterium]
MIERKLLKEKTKDGLKKIFPKEDVSGKSIIFLKRKINTMLIIIGIGAFISFAYEWNRFSSGELLDGEYIKRNEYMGKEKKIRLKVSNGSNDESCVIDCPVSERIYDDEQLMMLAKEVQENLWDIIRGENESLDKIISDMEFPSAIDGYPFKITWRTDDPLLIEASGIINQERFDKLSSSKNIYEGILTGIHAELSYEKFLQEIDFNVRIFPKNSRNEYSFGEYIELMIKESEESSRREEVFRLPEVIDNIPLVYEEMSDMRSMIIFIMLLLISILLYFREDQELDIKVKKRDRELMRDYTSLVNKFVLFYSAGLTTRGIWSKLCKDYRIRTGNKDEKSYLYEEMLICEGWINEGMGEIVAYEKFAGRCGLHKYRQFISLIGQAMGKGREDLLLMLESEALEAFQERKNRAKELGEEAGTKLLFPMLMMLLVVLIIVMVPALISFRM